jgi:hypothetical protein
MIHAQRLRITFTSKIKLIIFFLVQLKHHLFFLWIVTSSQVRVGMLLFPQSSCILSLVRQAYSLRLKQVSHLQMTHDLFANEFHLHMRSNTSISLNISWTVTQTQQYNTPQLMSLPHSCCHEIPQFCHLWQTNHCCCLD